MDDVRTDEGMRGRWDKRGTDEGAMGMGGTGDEWMRGERLQGGRY